jgi:heme exporter protein A
MPLTHTPLHLAVNDLACRRGGRLVFSGIGFTIGPGEALVLTGRNGAGKSSLLGVLLGRIAAEAGDIRLENDNDRSIAEVSHHVGHKDALKATLTAVENLDFARTMLGEAHLSCDEALQAVGLGHAAAIPVGYLSAGQKRRVALARLLVAKRPLWLLDEPTALDAAAQDMLTGLMKTHLSQGGLIIAATHAPLNLADLRELKLGASA